jgi:hypothetical protein
MKEWVISQYRTIRNIGPGQRRKALRRKAIKVSNAAQTGNKVKLDGSVEFGLGKLFPSELCQSGFSGESENRHLTAVNRKGRSRINCRCGVLFAEDSLLRGKEIGRGEHKIKGMVSVLF